MTRAESRIEIRAFRGKRRSAVYREHVLSTAAFAQIVAVAGRARLSLLPTLERHGSQELDKRRARQLASELGSVQAGGGLPQLDDELTAFGEVVRWCARSSGESWLKIEGV